MNEPLAPSRSITGLLVVSVAGFLVFGTIAWSVQTGNELTRLDAGLAETLDEHASEHPDLVLFFRGVSELSGRYAFAGLTAVIGVILLWRRQYRLAAVCVVVLLGGEGINNVLKEVFQRPRPPHAHASGWSFPSGHSMRALVSYGLLACLLSRWLCGGIRVAACTFLVGAIVAVGFSRLYLGNHYLSDVAGAFAVGIGWVAAWLVLIRIAGKEERALETNEHTEGTSG